MKRISLVILFLILFISSSAQTSSIHFKHLSVADGLSHSSVITMKQDTLGQMWIGTRNGLNKYDGTQFTIYKNQPVDSTSLSNNDILSLEEDSEGYLWVGTYNGLNRYDPVKDVFKRYYQTDAQNSLCNNVIICSKEMPNGEIWFGTANGISVYDKVSDAFMTVPYIASDKSSLPYKNIQRIFVDGGGNTWIATSAGLAKLIRRNDNRFEFKQFEWKENSENLFIQDIIQIEPNILSLATKYNGYVLFDVAEEKYRFPEYSEIPRSTDVRVLQRTEDGKIWMGTTRGIKILNTEQRVVDIKSHRNDRASLSHNFIRCILKDRNGTIWVGTYNGGINLWDESNENFISFINYDIDNNVVNAVVSDNNDNLYFGSEGGDITILNPYDNTIDILKVSQSEESKPNSIQSLLLTGQNKLWVGVLNYGVYTYDLKSKKQVNDIISDELQEYLKNTGVYVIKEGKGGVYWLGTFGKGLVRFDSKNGVFNVFGLTIGEEPKLSTNIIKTLLIDSSGNIWAGGLGGLNLLQFEDADSYTVSNYFLQLFSANDIKTLFEDERKQIWAGTKTKGLQKFNGTDFERVFLDKDNPITSVYTILEDELGCLWLSCDRGIVKYNPANHTSVIYDQQNLLATNEFNSNAGLKSNSGRFYFGGASGVTSFDPDRLVKNEYKPKVILSDLKVKNRSLTVKNNQDILTKTIAYTESITLGHNNSNFSVNFALPNFINPENNQYAYRLIGLDPSWTYTNRTEAFYTLQKPGDYVFEVKAANNDGVWNETPAKLGITVEAAPWKSNWAYTLYVLLITLALLGLYANIKSKVKLKQDLLLGQLENERQEETYRAKLQFFTNISHDFRTPLTLISGPLQQLLSDYKGSSLMYKKLLVIESSANHLLQLINRLMDFRKLESQQYKLQAAEGNIVKFLKEIYLSFTEFAKNGNYTYTFDCPEQVILAYYDRPKLEQVFYNLIYNAFKYTPENGTVTLVVRKDADKIYICVSDSGTGIKKEHLNKVFDRFFEIPKENGIKDYFTKGTGIGLSIAKSIIDLHQGSIAVKNNLGKGAMFEVRLLLGKEHLTDGVIISDFKFSDDLGQYTSQLTEKELISNRSLDDFRIDKNLPVILIVEDNGQLRVFIKNLLKKEYIVHEARDGKQGLEKALKYIPDLIISDVIMPKMVGTELCALIKQDLRTSHIPVILLTSRTSLIYKIEGLGSGADDYISKPFNIKIFLLRVKNLLESAQRLKQKFSSETKLIPDELTVSTLDEKLLKKALDIVKENISNPQFDIPTFCRELGVSRTILFSKIKAWTNFTPNEFINEIRLKRAAYYLENYDMNISQVSQKVGFSDPKYFSKCFQKKFSETPSKFVKKFSGDFK